MKSIQFLILPFVFFTAFSSYSQNQSKTDKSKEFNRNLVEFIEFKNSLQVSKITTFCAINRKESRGSHYRSDYTNTDSSFDKCTLIVKDSDSIKISFEEIL